MNAYATYLLLTGILAVAVLGAGSAYAQINPACPNCEGNPQELAEEAVLAAVPLSLWLDQTTYDSGEVITVSGHVANLDGETPVTLVVRTPSGNVAWVGQVAVDENGDFETQVASSGWSETGVYQVLGQYGHSARDNRAQFVLTDVVVAPMVPVAEGCMTSEVAVEDYCVPYEIMGGSVTGVSVNQDDSSLVVHIVATDDGKLTMTFPAEVLEDVLLVLVDGEESDDVMIDGQSVSLYFSAGAESAEFFAGRVIPEFGVLAAAVLAVALVSVIVVSSRSRLGMAPRL